jgi:nucleoside-diphosphate-sugar epimerase
MVVSILGCGWYGKALAKLLVKDGFTIKGSATAHEKLETLSQLGVNPYLVKIKADEESYDPEFFNCDVLIISIPPKTRQGEGGDYLPKIQRIISTILKYNIAKVIYISSTAVYGDSNSEVNELTAPEPDTEPGRILLAAEKLFRDQATFKTTIIRFAGLVGPGRHPGRFFAGKKAIPNGKAPVNLIHLDDCAGITIAIIKQDAFGYLLNAVSPDHPQKSDFYYRATLQTGLIAPEFISELNNWKLINSTNLYKTLKYKFKAPQCDDYNFDD